MNRLSLIVIHRFAQRSSWPGINSDGNKIVFQSLTFSFVADSSNLEHRGISKLHNPELREPGARKIRIGIRH